MKQIFDVIIVGAGASGLTAGIQAARQGAKGLILEHMEKYLSQGMEKKDAMKQVAKDRGIGKREVYKMLLE